MNFLDTKFIKSTNQPQYEIISPRRKRTRESVIIEDLNGKSKIRIHKPKVPIKMDLNDKTSKIMENKFQKMLLGKLPDFGYGQNLIVTENRTLWEYLFESTRESSSLEICRNVSLIFLYSNEFHSESSN